MNGVLNIDKPPGMTSHDVVYRVRKAAGQKRVGHSGTLDPDATGVLLVCLGHATRLTDLLAEQGKQYEAVLRLGVTTSTEDSSGQILKQTDPSSITVEQLAAILPQFVGTIAQIPPMVSAVHHNGKRLYELARTGIVVEREAREIQIDSIELLHFSGGSECSAALRIACGKGTYIRTLCADMGAALGVGGHMSSLRRTAVGKFGIVTSVPLDKLSKDSVADYLVSSSAAVGFLPKIEMTETQRADVLNGKQIAVEYGFESGVHIRLVFGAELVGLGRTTEYGMIQPEKVFPA